MGANGVNWKVNNVPVVYIESLGSVDEILSAGVIESELKATGLQALGVVVDANGSAGDRWNQIKVRCRGLFPALPENLPEGGLEICELDEVRFGVWIMPDNRFAGMLEDFLIRLIPDTSQNLYELARECVDEAVEAGAQFRPPHRRKAELHTWLAWQNEPGRQLHEAVNYRILDPGRPESIPFVNWFRSLFGV